MILPNFDTDAAAGVADHQITDEDATVSSLTPAQFEHLAYGIMQNFDVRLSHDSLHSGYVVFTHVESGAFLRKADVTTVIEAWHTAAHIYKCMEGGDDE